MIRFFRKCFALTVLFLIPGFCFLTARAAEPTQGISCFSPDDFSREESALTGICITGVPDPETGRIVLGSRVIRPGDVLTAQQMEQMVFLPAFARSDAQALIRYLPVIDNRVRQETHMVISLRGKENQAPVSEDFTAETYKNLPLEGLLKVSDPEEESLSFTLTRAPRRGSVIFREDGSFLYTPEKNKVGTDSFTYVATDPAGNRSRQTTVTIRILKTSDSLLYADTQGLSCRFEAEWLRRCGIFTGEQISGQLCFSPGEGVTRGQFLAMLMDTLELPVDHGATDSGFSDGAPPWLIPYLSAGLQAGIIRGSGSPDGPVFAPEQLITGEEAAAMIQAALHFTVPTLWEGNGTVAAWTEDATAALRGEDLALPEGPVLVTRADAAVILYRVSKLKSQGSWLRSLLGL